MRSDFKFGLMRSEGMAVPEARPSQRDSAVDDRACRVQFDLDASPSSSFRLGMRWRSSPPCLPPPTPALATSTSKSCSYIECCHSCLATINGLSSTEGRVRETQVGGDQSRGDAREGEKRGRVGRGMRH
eukprot:3936151-Rhodomonas_salina.1